MAFSSSILNVLQKCKILTTGNRWLKCSRLLCAYEHKAPLFLAPNPPLPVFCKAEISKVFHDIQGKHAQKEKYVQLREDCMWHKIEVERRANILAIQGISNLL
jgi:hypothetical protein